MEVFMKKRGVFTKILLVTGTIFVWIPLMAPVVFSFIFLARAGLFRFDYLMPFELFAFAFTGGVLLIWASARSGEGWKKATIPLGLAILFLVFSQGLAVLTGIASGERTAEGIWMWMVVTLLIVTGIAMIWLGVTGIKLIRAVFRKADIDHPV